MNYKIYKNGIEIKSDSFIPPYSISEKFVLVFHGLFGRAKNWHNIIKKLSSTVQKCFIVLDLRNHGENKPTLDISYELMVEDVYNFIKTKNIKKFSIIGHSMGGKLGMLFTLKNPQFINQLFVVDIAPVNYPFQKTEIVDHLIELDLNKCGSRNDAEKLLSKNINEKNLRIFLLQNLKYHDGKYRWSLNLDAIKSGMSDLRSFPINEKINSTNIKTICIWGENSNYLNDDYKIEFRRLFTNLRFKKVNNAGHWLHFEQSDEFVDLISKNFI